MLKLQRALRYKEEIELPNGETISINLNVEEHAIEMIRAQNEVIKAAQEYAKERTEDNKTLFYGAHMHLLAAVVGPENVRKMRHAYDGDDAELINIVDGWLANQILPLIFEASKRIRARKAAGFRDIIGK